MGGVGARNWRRGPRRGARNRTGVYGTLPYAAGGIVLWLLLHEAGLHSWLPAPAGYLLSPICCRNPTRSYIRFSSTICPSCHFAMV